MLYALFLIIAIAYNIRKFARERQVFLSSIVEASSESHREMILSHHFYVFIFEAFLSFIVAHLITDRASSLGILALGGIYASLLFVGFFFYRFFVRYIESQTALVLWDSFKSHLIKELRVSFAVILLPILIYALINWAFQGEVYQEWGKFWFIGLLFNVIFVSVLTICCSVIIMLRLIPNREITEPEYLEVINRKLEKIGMPGMRIRWIETDIKNAFVVGLKLLKFSNQTMFIGRSLRTKLSMEEFEAVVAHELSHVANRHIQKRVIDLMKNLISILLGIFVVMMLIFLFSYLYWGEDVVLYTETITFMSLVGVLGWAFLNYAVLFDGFRAQEFEADAYAVIELEASAEALESALRKLTDSEELPEYLKKLNPKKNDKNIFVSWLKKKFSTHPDLETRIASVNYKIAANLPYNHYVSPVQRLRGWFGHVFQWRVLVPGFVIFCFSIGWGAWNLKLNREAIAYISNHSAEEIKSNPKIAGRINSRPYFMGPTLMAWIVKKQDPELIDYFIEKGANKGKTLVYLSQQKDLPLFKQYYTRFENELGHDEYYLILRRSAEMNFTEGYRLLVNSRHFEGLNPNYKEKMTQIQMSNSRKPASTKE